MADRGHKRTGKSKRLQDVEGRDGWAAEALLTVAEMAECDRRAIAMGTPGPVLMANAGHAVTTALVARWTKRRVTVLCGPGNNGGDGFVVARLLAEQGWPVRLAAAQPVASYAGDARHHAERWQGPVERLLPEALDGSELVVDALFGSGLNRPLAGDAAAIIAALAARKLASLAVDVPSGLSGDSGAALGIVAPADLTVTFFRAKPGHYLLPGRALRGTLVVADIGIPDGVLDAVKPRQALNGPRLWQLPVPAADGHKYQRGYVLIRAGEMSGAGRLAARGARRIGAGMVTVAVPPAQLLAFAADQPGLILREAANAQAFAKLLGDRRLTGLLVGPGNGRGRDTREAVLAALATGRATVLDADALTAFAGEADGLAEAIAGPTVLTPHDGEFASLFGRLPGDKLGRARAAALLSGATVLLKGGDTVIAHPDGRAVINANAPPDLATAGAGDVLAGMIAGLLAQGLAPFAAAAAAAWLHGAAAARFGAGLIAEDLPEALPPLVEGLRRKSP
jgi:ADP-dependent NAD(P)H-hydrate dehydratase / NAD(P)H-hydrate epimerase